MVKKDVRYFGIIPNTIVLILFDSYSVLGMNGIVFVHSAPSSGTHLHDVFWECVFRVL